MPFGQFFPATVLNEAPTVFDNVTSFNKLATFSSLTSSGQVTTPASTILAPTGDTTGVKDTSTFSSLVSAAAAGSGGTITLGAGSFYINSNQVTARMSGGPVFITGAGIGTTTLYVLGSGDGLRMFNPTSPPGGFTGLTVFGGGVLDLTLDGSLASAGATGLHIGDGECYQVRCQIQHFNGASSTGLHIDNSVWWTEKGTWRVKFVDTTTAVLQTTASGNNSNAENDFDWVFFLKPNQNAINMQGIAHYLGRLKCRGVFNQGGTANTGVFLTMDASSAINNCLVDVALNLGSTGAVPQTMNLTTGASLQSNNGRLVFNGTSGWTSSNIVWSSNVTAFNFFGDVFGDSNIASGGGTPTTPNQPCAIAAGTPVVYAKAFARASDGKINDFCGDFFDFGTLTASITVGLGGSGSGSAAGPQRKTIRAKQASGTAFTLTWPHNASPSGTAPTVLWSGGTAPTMTASANAVDIYKLETFDGATWYGQAIQNVS